jgi:hypothetical protein
MDFTLFDALRGTVFSEDDAWDKGMVKVCIISLQRFFISNINNIMVLPKIMIMNRINEVYKNDFRKYQMTMALILTIPDSCN